MDTGGYIDGRGIKAALGLKGGVNPIAYKGGFRREIWDTLEVRERQQFIRRYKWENLPSGVTAEMIERILYYRGRLTMIRYNDNFYTLPFALNGGIDLYGRYNAIVPLTFNGSLSIDEDGIESLVDAEFNSMPLKVCYDKDDTVGKEAVILNDYTQGISEFILPRYQLNKIYREELGNIVVLIKHNLVSSARVFHAQILDEGQLESARAEYEGMEEKILDEGKRIFITAGTLGLKEVFNDKTLETQNYWECFVSLDNLRENMIGIENNGIFKKKERQLKGEQEIEASSADLVYRDGLENRRQWAERVNAVWGLNIQCNESDVITGVEEEEDGEVYGRMGNTGEL